MPRQIESGITQVASLVGETGIGHEYDVFVRHMFLHLRRISRYEQWRQTWAKLWVLGNVKELTVD